jgi:hypothetical protein
MVEARARHGKVRDDVQRFQGYVQNRIPVINTGSKSALGLERPVALPLKHRSTHPLGNPGIRLLNLVPNF